MLCLETQTKVKKTSSCLGDSIGAAHIFQMEKVRPPREVKTQAQEEGLLLGSLAGFTGRCLVRREGSPGHEALWHRALTEFLRPHFKVAWKANHAFP